MRITSHAMGTTFIKVLPSGEVQVASMLYTKRGRTTRRLPMGKGKKTKRERLDETQAREAMQEAAKDQGNFVYVLEFPRLVFWDVVKDDNNPSEELHLKAFMVACVTEGELRDFQHLDQELDADGKPIPEEDEILGPLVYHEIRELLNMMSESGKGLYVHITAVLATLNALAGKYPAVAVQYGGILERSEVLARIKPNQQYKEEVVRYVRSLHS